MSQSLVEKWQYDAQNGVTAVSLSQDGTRVLAGTLGKTAVYLNSSGQLLWQRPVGNQAWRVGLSGDGETAVIGTGSTRFWDMKGRGLSCFNGDGTLRWQQDLEASIWGLAISVDGNTIAAGTSEKNLLLFDGQGHLLWRQVVPGLGWYAWVWSASLSADGQVIAAGAADKRIRVMQRSGERLTEHRTRADVFATAVSADGTVIGAGDSSGHVYCLDRKGHLLWEEGLADKVWSVALSANGQRLLVGAGEKEAHIRLYNQAGQFLWKRHVGGSVTNVGLSADGRRIVAGTRDGGIFIFDEDRVLHQARAGKIVRDVAISANGEWVTAGSEDGVVYGFHLPPTPPLPEEFATETTDESPPEAKTGTDDHSLATKLYQILYNRFNLEEVRTLCFYLNVEFDDLRGEGRAAKIRELVRLMQRWDQLDRLRTAIQQLRGQ